MGHQLRPYLLTDKALLALAAEAVNPARTYRGDTVRQQPPVDRPSGPRPTTPPKPKAAQA